VWGLAFKPNTDDMREAPSLVIINKLLEHGAKVTAYDPAAMEVTKRILKDRITYAESNYEALKGADALMILTEWNEFRNPEFSQIKENLKSPVIFDGRNIFDPKTVRDLGFVYYGIGRR
jgi:UDPglucose 6-dehydrogenase